MPSGVSVKNSYHTEAERLPGLRKTRIGVAVVCVLKAQ